MYEADQPRRCGAVLPTADFIGELQIVVVGVHFFARQSTETHSSSLLFAIDAFPPHDVVMLSTACRRAGVLLLLLAVTANSVNAQLKIQAKTPKPSKDGKPNTLIGAAGSAFATALLASGEAPQRSCSDAAMLACPGPADQGCTLCHHLLNPRWRTPFWYSGASDTLSVCVQGLQPYCGDWSPARASVTRATRL